MPMTSTEMIKLLLKNGFKQIPGGKGSHKKFFQESTGKFTVVPDHKQEIARQETAEQSLPATGESQSDTALFLAGVSLALSALFVAKTKKD